MERAHTFQKSKTLLDVGGHRFATSLQTLTAVPDTFLASMFSGRHELHPDNEGVYFIDRDGTHFRHILNYLRDTSSFKLNPELAVTGTQRAELAVELQYYGLLDRVMPHYAQEQIGISLLKHACAAGTKQALQAAVAQARELVVEMGSTSPWLTNMYQDVRYVITERTVNSAPVWAAEGGERFIFRSVENQLWIGSDDMCAKGAACGWICHTQVNADFLAPTTLPATGWRSLGLHATLESQYASAGGTVTNPWVDVPSMRVTAVHGLADDEPAMAAALRQLATLNEKPRQLCSPRSVTQQQQPAQSPRPPQQLQLYQLLQIEEHQRAIEYRQQ